MRYFLALALVLFTFSCTRSIDTYKPEPYQSQTPSENKLPPSFDDVDKNRDGKITFSEYYDYILYQNIVPAFTPTREKVSKQFDFEDKNRDNILDRNEYGSPHNI